jgi:hypothetical protein
VLFLGWTVFPLVLMYWLENVVVGGFNVAKMALAQPGDAILWAGKAFVIPFFVLHFGGFTYIHGVLVLAFFGPRSPNAFHLVPTVLAAIRANRLGWGVLSLVLSHGFSFYWNYLRSGEYRRASLTGLMGQPYARIVVLHVVVLCGGWVVMLLGSPLGALLVLVALKTAVDLRAHQAERRKFAPPPPPSPPSPPAIVVDNAVAC